MQILNYLNIQEKYEPTKFISEMKSASFLMNDNEELEDTKRHT
jgi:hypothetical protein